MGQTLFVRTRRGLEPNELGHCVIRYARLIMTDMSHLREEMKAALEGAGGRLSVGMIMGATLCLGGAKLLIGMQRNKPVEFLGVMLVVTFLVTIALMYKPRRTRVGERELKRVLDSQADLKKRAKNAAIELGPAEAAMAIALLGVTQCNSAQFEGMHQAIRVTDSGSGGCGSGVWCPGSSTRSPAIPR